MNKRLIITCIATLSVAIFTAIPAVADSFSFSTGNPDGLIATLSRVASPGKLETETADDFVTTQTTILNSATFIGLLPSGTPLSAVTQVEIELYNVFPIDSTNPPDGRVLTRKNSPSDNNFAARDSNVPGQLSFTTTLINPSFHALNSVVNGIHAKPNQFTGGEGPVTGEEVQFNVTFTTPFTVGKDHIFFRPEVGLSSGDFLWLSAPKPIMPPGLRDAGIAGRASRSKRKIAQCPAAFNKLAQLIEWKILIDTIRIYFAEWHSLDKCQCHVALVGEADQAVHLHLSAAAQAHDIDLHCKTGRTSGIDPVEHICKRAATGERPITIGVERIERNIDASHAAAC